MTTWLTWVLILSSSLPLLLGCLVVGRPLCDIWYLESGYNNHMTGNLNLFYSLDNWVQTYVTLGNNVQVIVFGKVTVGITRKNMVKGFPLIDKPERVCEGCIFGK